MQQRAPGERAASRTRPDFVSAVRALDRVLISGSHVVPLFYLPQQWVARRAYIHYPRQTSLFGFLPETWWHEPKAGAAVIATSGKPQPR